MPLAAGFVVILIIASLSLTNQFRRFDLNAWDLCTRITCKWHKPDPRILMVGVNQESMDYFSSHGILWPWPRDFWAHLIYLAERDGAAGVMFDVLFDDPGINRLNSDARVADSLFAARLSDDFPTIIASILNPGEELLNETPPQLLAENTKVPTYSLPNHKLILPNQIFRKANIGLTNVIADDDGVYRSVPLLYESVGKKLYTLGYRTATLIDDINVDNLKLDDKNRFLLRYYGKGGPGGAFPYQAAGDLIMGNYPVDSLKGKILIIGGYAAGLMDYKPTPVADVNYPYPGFEIHATFISNLLQEDGLGHIPKAASFILTLLFGMLALAAFTVFKNIWQQIVSLICIAAFILLLTLGLFNSGWLLSVVSPLLACFLSVGIYLYAGWRLEGRQRLMLHNMFSRYLDQNVIESLIDNPEELGLIGVNRKATILFTDMVGFTPMSEGLSPEEIVLVLNDYHTVVVEAILKNKGLLDKYVGDAVMALFGAPLEDAESQLNAAKAIKAIHQSVDALSEARKRKGLPIIDVRIGVHTDNVVVGNIGHPKRMDYTAIGSGVNMASRLEGATRLLGTRNLVSQDFCEGITENVIARRELGKVKLKGQNIPMIVFELLIDKQPDECMEKWAKAWELWKADQRQEAYNLWESLKSDLKEDKALPILLSHMVKFINGTGDDYVRKFSSK